MKATVCFGKTGIVVPCKDGKMTVKELIQQAAQRYIKAKEKEPGYWVKIHHLEYIDGGILDPDDVVADVIEDKDKLIALFDEHNAYNRSDDAANITERLSPDPFEAELASQRSAFHPVRGEIEVTPSALKLGTPLLVRRSSDPAVGPVVDFHPATSYASEQNNKLSVQGFSKVAPTEELKDLSLQEEHLRLQRSRYDYSELTRKMEISGDGGPLGIHVVPFYSSVCERTLGLYIRGVEENSRSRRDGLFQENECIVKINNVDLMDRSFPQSQEIFRQAMKNSSVLVEVVPSHYREQYEKSVLFLLKYLEDDDNDDEVPNIKPPPPPGRQNTLITEPSNGIVSSLISSMQPPLTSELSPHGVTFSPPSFPPPSLPPLGFGNKNNARKLRIDLKKGADGLGFTVVTRDSTVHGPGPIFVKNILPKGAAIKDGRLLSGDRILEVNGWDVAGRTQEELVALLRSTKLGEIVSLVVARPDEAFLPRELKGEPDCFFAFPENTAQMTFEIPLNDSGSAGLGVSLKGNKSRDTHTDLGIFIKSIIHGGAAFKDGRLRVNDQLLAVNGESLIGKTNRVAMETLRRSMSMEGNIRGMIQLVILRRLDRQTEERSDAGGILRTNLDNLNMSEQNGLQDRLKGFTTYEDGNAEYDVPPPLPPHPSEHIIVEYSKFGSGVESSQQPDSFNLKASKSMDLVADESNIAALTGPKSDSPGKDLGPRLGLKKSSSLESLQTAVAEVKKNELPFYRPRPHMVRGRGCNESFRAAIDKSYDGPEAEDEDGLSDVSSHSSRETPSTESGPPGNPELKDADKSKKDKKKKEKKKEKTKVKDKKKREESEDQEKKNKKKGFAAIMRFGKKKEEKGGKVEQKGIFKPGVLKEEEQEIEKMKEERERINAKHYELREKQTKGLFDYSASADMEDDDMDPNYARVNHFKEPPPHHPVHRPLTPGMSGTLSYQRETQIPTSESVLVQELYAKINKKPQAQDAVDSARSTSGNADRIQQLRMEYHQARREGLYEEEQALARPAEYEQSWVSRGTEAPRNLRYEGMERQYASLPSWS
ncbi:partitioning defective 3 homolog B isoform X2 [Bombina bombina]|uniref:partitioning defective 3 homolog B isoform X2 n=1 Tax=Bombina bombina TaxID=8345 RepID=UPI00235B1D09|nr:partitioning defective 3 homolog B isoform X2 [Bombina bombina]